MRRPLISAGLSVAALSALSACGGSHANDTPASGAASSGGETTSSSNSSSGAAGSGGGGGTSGSSAGGSSATVITPGGPGPHDVLFAVDTTKGAHPISRYIYGSNWGDLTGEAKGLTVTRMGGNRLTAYNWETNASNAGSDYLYENDMSLSPTSMTPGYAMKQATQTAFASAASIIMTVPIAGWVSANWTVQCPSMPTPAQIAENFFPIFADKGSAYQYPPDLTDGKVYEDEFVWWMESQFPTAQTDPTRRIFYQLDNEPDLWSSTHSEIHPSPVSYAELVQKNTEFAAAIKRVAPQALVFGPVDYGWQGYANLQNAPDADMRDWIEFYLDSMKSAEGSAGKRLVDVLDVHWYPEATGGGARITDDGVSEAEVEARLQAPRSLWDPTYTETSWISADSVMGPIELIPRMMTKIDGHYPGTRLSFTEYYYGAGGDISGGLAEADVLGVFGAQGVFAATTWPLGAVHQFLFAGFAMYRNYDGHGATFGDTSVSLANSDIVDTSGYASVFAAGSADVVVVAINKETTAVTAGITLRHTAQLGAADVYVLTSAAASPQKGTGLKAVAENAFSYAMPPRSATTLVFHP